MARCPRDVRYAMRISHLAFGVLEIDRVTYEHDLVIDRNEIQKRKNKASRKFREAFGQTPLLGREHPVAPAWSLAPARTDGYRSWTT